MNSSRPSIWSEARRSDPRPNVERGSSSDLRSAFEHDYDRLIFSTPVRRLADKTQVFPLERNDSVRTRLTHSHEVSNLARSIGNRLIRLEPRLFGGTRNRRSAPIILAAVGLAHDLGNPPFGHQGELAIGRWFQTNRLLFDHAKNCSESQEIEPIPESACNDFLRFEGNAQTLRLVSRLQVSLGGHGLNLTAGTLAALMKYTVSSGETNKAAGAASKKHGFFESESDVVEWIRERTGVRAGQRHPLTWLMEACDDIAYSVLDIEGAIKKGIVSPEDVFSYLKRNHVKKSIRTLIDQLNTDFENAENLDQPVQIVREIKTSYLRTRLIETLLTGAANEFLKVKKAVLARAHTKPLLETQTARSRLCQSLKGYAFTYAYKNQDVLKIEYQGARILSDLMDALWRALTERKEFRDLKSDRTTPFSSYTYSLISDNYRQRLEHPESYGTSEASISSLPIRYREFQLLTDMISGMTDGFALDLHRKLCRGVA